MTKQYPIIHLNGFMYMLDKEAPLKGTTTTDGVNIYPLTEARDNMYVTKGFEEHLRKRLSVIVASSDSSLNLPLLPNIEEDEEMYRLANLAMEGGKGLPDGLKEYRGKAVDWAFDKFIKGYKAASAKNEYTHVEAEIIDNQVIIYSWIKRVK